jgi:DNA-directed RNA polymerase subunit M/transcription elongation factor TFIIS
MKFCSRCGSQDITYAVLGTTLPIYKCKTCGYRGPIIVEDGILSEKLKEEFEQKE